MAAWPRASRTTSTAAPPASAGRSGARVVVDTSGEALRQLKGGEAFLIKPNVHELQELAGRELEDDDEQVEAAQHAIGTAAARSSRSRSSGAAPS
jgi:fructose-1-phosphate kinase PfkB-like protein